MLARRSLARHDSTDRHSQWGLAFRSFRENRLALTGAVLIATLYSIAFLCPLLAPFNPGRVSGWPRDAVPSAPRAPAGGASARRARGARHRRAGGASQ
ncbi:MAG: hypothetical protein IPP94_11525 [Ignavibacteria bacterium]|nr:hypothetical protein [Ignavibacteria bacterium]